MCFVTVRRCISRYFVIDRYTVQLRRFSIIAEGFFPTLLEKKILCSVPIGNLRRERCLSVASKYGLNLNEPIEEGIQVCWLFGRISLNYLFIVNIVNKPINK